MNSRIFIDFDGTITNVWRRYFLIMAHFFNLPDDMFDTYKELKSITPNDRILLSNLLKVDTSTLDAYFEYKHRNIESEKYLRHDTLLVHPSILEELANNYDLKVVTMRHNKDSIYNQYYALKISFLASRTVVLSPKGENTKLNWLKKSISENDKVIFIGDSEADMATGALQNCMTVFVRTGLRSLGTVSKKYKPDYVFNNINICLQYLPDLVI